MNLGMLKIFKLKLTHRILNLNLAYYIFLLWIFSWIQKKKKLDTLFQRINIQCLKFNGFSFSKADDRFTSRWLTSQLTLSLIYLQLIYPLTSIHRGASPIPMLVMSICHHLIKGGEIGSFYLLVCFCYIQGYSGSGMDQGRCHTLTVADVPCYLKEAQVEPSV